ncbi:DUF3244 domain-containing protein [Flavobacterium agrisoli]|uniref:Secretion protein n=1 Tax=Flavobacterium agrisoli TaxID=2793066 RepID=A0A934UJ73_9FLAO|nr:DUF3244 domain-containing protein [Flavobacterium agrisoli]MBK0369183.1 secretion protein [Flavobacterium agrisoli]
MKTILKLSLVCALLFTGVTTYAEGGNGDFKLHVIKNDKNKISFCLNHVKKAKVSIYEKDGTLVYSENSVGSSEGILKTFSLEEFPAGKYFLEIENNDKKVIHEITVTSSSASLSRNAVTEIYKNNINESNSNVASR